MELSILFILFDLVVLKLLFVCWESDRDIEKKNETRKILQKEREGIQWKQQI